jgi:hypothetical protein
MSPAEVIARAMLDLVVPGASWGDQWKFVHRKLTDDAAAILAALDAAGLAVVPKEPTEEMQIAGTEQWLTVRAMEDRAAVIYRAMLAAAKEGER